MTFKEQLNIEGIPHVAVIMDGNGRWAKNKGQYRIFGHQNGVDSVDKISKAAGEIGVKYLTFSTENWNRPEKEVDALMDLRVDAIRNNVGKMMKNNVRLLVLGDMGRLPEKTINNLLGAISTKGELGISNFLMWQLSYSELYFNDVCWPEFKKKHFLKPLSTSRKEKDALAKQANKF